MVDGVGGSSGSNGNGSSSGLGGGMDSGAGIGAGLGIGNQPGQTTTDDVTSPNSPTTLDSLAAQPTTLESVAAQPTTLEALTNTPAPAQQPAAEVEESFVCNLPAVSIGFGVSAYAGVGGGANFGVSYDPKTGNFGFDVGLEVGVGLGSAGKFDMGRQLDANATGPDRGVSVGMGLSANAQAGNVGVGVEHEMVGSNMHASALDRTNVSVSPAGAGATINANVYAGGSVGGNIYDPGCAPPMT